MLASVPCLCLSASELAMRPVWSAQFFEFGASHEHICRRIASSSRDASYTSRGEIHRLVLSGGCSVMKLVHSGCSVHAALIW